MGPEGTDGREVMRRAHKGSIKIIITMPDGRRCTEIYGGDQLSVDTSHESPIEMRQCEDGSAVPIYPRKHSLTIKARWLELKPPRRRK